MNYNLIIWFASFCCVILIFFIIVFYNTLLWTANTELKNESYQLKLENRDLNKQLKSCLNKHERN